MTNYINFMGFDQSTSLTGVFAGQFDLDKPPKAPKVILWETIGKKRKKADPFESCMELHEIVLEAHRKLLSKPVCKYHAFACEDGYFDDRYPKVGLQIKMSQGWVDAVVAATCGAPVHHFMPNAWRAIWGSYSLRGDALKDYSILLAKAHFPDVIELDDHMADAYWITCHLFKQIVDGVITI